MAEFIRLECIGSGSFGKVWLVRYTNNHRKYALKEVTVQGMDDKDIDQAVTEVKVLSRLSHFNIIRYKQAFIKNKSLNIVMEYADGGDLHKKIEQANGCYFSEKLVLSWFVQITFALKYIHQENILHRDLKTQNIFITSDNIVKVGDFGIAKVLSGDSGIAETAIGTPYYLSPEICQSKPYNKKSDVWALGCILYEMATLKHAFESTTFNHLVMKIIYGEYGSLPSYYSYDPVSSLIETMLQHDPEDRPSADHILRLPNLRPHIAEYEKMATNLLESRRSRRQSEVGGANHRQLLAKKRSQSVDSGKRAQSDLRKLVLLRQAMTRGNSPVFSRTYVVSPSDVKELDGNSQEHSDDDDVSSPPQNTNDVFHDENPTASIDNSLDVTCQALISASKSHIKQSVEQLSSHISVQLGPILADKLNSAVNTYMNEALSDTSASVLTLKLKEVVPTVKSDIIQVAILLWYLKSS